MMNLSVKALKLHDNAVIPTRATPQSAGYDLRACLDNDITIQPHETVKIPTGLAFELEDNVFGAIFARSGLSTKHGIRPANCVGVCDPDYRGQYMVPLRNDSDEAYTIQNGDKIAQLIFIPFGTPANIEVISELSETERGTGGFNSTGR